MNWDKAKDEIKKIDKNILDTEWKVPVFSSGPISDERGKNLDELQKQFRSLGLKVAFYPSAEKFLSKETATATPIKLSGRVTDIVDPLVMFASFRENSPYIYERPLPDDQLETLYKKAESSEAIEDRVQAVRALSKYVVEQNYVIPIMEQQFVIYQSKQTRINLGKQNQPMTVFIDRIRSL